MSKLNATGQVAGISYTDAQKAKASGAITDAGYLGGTTWLKAQYDAGRDFALNGSSQFQQIAFADALEGLSIPDGEFDFFDKTFNLTNKGITDLLVGFVNTDDTSASDGQHPKDSSNYFPLPFGLNQGQFTPDGNGGKSSNFLSMGSVTTNRMGIPFLVTHDYTECGPFGITGNLATAVAWGTNPPPTDTGGMTSSGNYHQPGNVASSRAGFGFWQYKDSTDAQAGFRYMVGLYGNPNRTCGLSSEADQHYVVKSMSLKTLNTGVQQLVIHFRKTEVTSGASLSQPDILISTLKINL
jgi:hypothetical protein